MAKSFYATLIEKVLLENPYLPGPTDGDTMQKGVEDFADDETDPNEFNVQGISQHKDKIVKRFMDKIQGFAANLEPDSIKTSTFGQIKDSVGEIFDSIDQVNNFAGAKLDQLTNEAPAIIAISIAGDPSKKAAFEALHKDLGEFSSSIEEIEGRFATLKAKITKFVGDVGSQG